MRRLIGGWRPRLSTVIASILITVLTLPLVGLFFFRLYENTLIRQTEGELIAQAAAIAASFALETEEAAISETKLGPPVQFAPPPSGMKPAEQYQAGRRMFLVYGRYTPVEPLLDLAIDPILPPRPASQPAAIDADFAALGAKLAPLLAATQKVTLAGFRVTDPRGVVIAGGDETGQSLAHVPEVAMALQGQYASALRQRISDEPPPPLYSISRGAKVRVFVALPVVARGRVAGVVYVSRTPNNIVKHLYGERGKVALSALSVLAVTLLIGYVFWRVISRPMTELLERTRRIADGDVSAIRPLNHHGTREMASLASGHLEMARKLQARSDTVRTFATHVSHELKSPLTSIQGAAELLRDCSEEMSPEERRKFHANIAADSDRLNLLVKRLIEMARAENAEPGHAVTSLGDAVAGIHRPPGLTLMVSDGADLKLRMSGENLAIVLSNLASNALRNGARELTLSARRQCDSVAIVAQDDGDGVAPENRDRIFEPFFTTWRDCGGAGLGLGIVTALVKAHNGSIRLAASEHGARFELTLPAA